MSGEKDTVEDWTPRADLDRRSDPENTSLSQKCNSKKSNSHFDSAIK
jgi:hypothetical protein